jgi:ribosomal protein S18 acetylase RimI-like enzyme
MKIKLVRRFSTRIFKAVNRLLPQLDRDTELMTEARFRAILRSEGTHFFIAETDDKEIAGMLSAVVYIIPTGTKFWIEDVVVDEAYRGKGIGKELMKSAIEYARFKGARSVDLTSRPDRVAANKLYQDLGFVLRETNVYRYKPG